MPGKTPMWGNPMKERFISLQESTYQQQQYNFQQEKNTLQHPKTVPNFCHGKRAQKYFSI
jgi:hypothetical protein